MLKHNDELTPRPYEPQRGRDLLGEAGFADLDGDGIIEGAEGVPFEFSLVYSAKPQSEAHALKVRDMLARVGILVTPEPTDFSAMLETIKRRDFDAISIDWVGSPGESDDVFRLFHSSSAEPGGNNFASYMSEEFDDLVTQARSEMDGEPRMRLWQRCHDILYRDQPYTFLQRRDALAFVHRRIANVRTTTRLGLNGRWFRRPMEWYIRADAMHRGE